MKAKKWIALLLAVLFALSLSACSQPTPDGSESPSPSQSVELQETQDVEDTGISVTDLSGREVQLDTAPQQVVALMPADCEILFALGLGESIIGRGEYCDYPTQALDIPAVQSGYELNLEQIIDLSPDVVFMSTMDHSLEQIEALENAGIPVVISSAQDESLESVYNAIELVGAVMGAETEAQSLVQQMQDSFRAVAEKVEGESGKTVYFEVSPLEYGLWTAGNNTFMNELCTMLGVENAFADVDGWAEISEEQVLERDPDYIVTITMYFGEGPRPEEEIAARPGWENLQAVQNGNILNADSNEISRPGPRLADAAETLYTFFYED